MTTPTIALGTMNFGKRTAEGESIRIVRRALERGIRMFDTANTYNEGESERILGRALGKDRENILVATKVGLARVSGKPEGLSPETMRRAIAGSLDRLKTDRLDVYYLHAPDRLTPIEQTMDAMKTLVDEGRVRSWGVSNYAAWEILEMDILADARSLARPSVTQLLYNLVHRQLDIEYFAFSRRYPIRTAIYNPLAGGLLAGHHTFEEKPTKGTRFDANAMYRRRYWTSSMFDRIDQVRSVAEQEGISMVDLAYRWVATRPDIDEILVGPASLDQLDTAIDAIGKPLSPDTKARLDELSREWNGTDTNYVR